MTCQGQVLVRGETGDPVLLSSWPTDPVLLNGQCRDGFWDLYRIVLYQYY